LSDKLMGSLFRKAERRRQEKAAKSGRDLQGKLRTLTGACTAVKARRRSTISRASSRRPIWA